MVRDKVRTMCSLKQMWYDMFDENCAKTFSPDDGFQGLVMLLETALSKTKYIISNHSSLKSTCDKHIEELEWKTQECIKLKAEVNRLETTKCDKCSLLETELLNYKKKSIEANNRIKSIANILKLGDNIEESDGQRKNSAMTLVSQMLLEESPKRKKMCLSNKTPSPKKRIIISDSCDGVIPETVTSITVYENAANNFETIDIITSPSDSGNSKAIRDRASRSVNFPVLSVRSPNIKKNLTADFNGGKTSTVSPKKTLKFNKQCLDELSLNGSLVDYVKDSNSELDKIWFCNISESEINKKQVKSSDHCLNESPDKLLNEAPHQLFNEVPDKLFNESPVEVLNGTPEKKVNKKRVWKMKEVRGPSEVSRSKRLRQMKLNLSVKNKKVDLCSLDGYDGGSSIISDKVKVQSINGKVNENSVEPKEIDTPSSEDFQPKATSTQKNEEQKKGKINVSKTTRSPNYKYKREAVRKKAERMKLDGWDCAHCAKYYGAVGLSPSKMKARINKCSRHRDKFDQLNQTPADYWNPLFPDTEECREKRLYLSVRNPKEESDED